MKHHASPDFWVCYRSLPEDARKLADQAYEHLKENPQYPSLHFKKVGRFWSARVGRKRRTIFWHRGGPPHSNTLGNIIEEVLMKRIAVANSTDVREGEIFAARTDGLPLILTRVDGRAYAVENKCAHLGWSMARGSITGSTLQCPWHGSKYDVCSGRNLGWVNSFLGLPMPRWTHGLIALGKKPAPIRTFETSEELGRVFINVPN